MHLQARGHLARNSVATELIVRASNHSFRIVDTKFRSPSVNAHAEELRTKFVAHEGKKTLTVTAVGTRYTVNFGKLAEALGEQLRQNVSSLISPDDHSLNSFVIQVVDPSLHEWIIPAYTTTTPSDVVICSVMMMSTLKA